jgi:hypothetical protein
MRTVPSNLTIEFFSEQSVHIYINILYIETCYLDILYVLVYFYIHIHDMEEG